MPASFNPKGTLARVRSMGHEGQGDGCMRFIRYKEAQKQQQLFLIGQQNGFSRLLLFFDPLLLVHQPCRHHEDQLVSKE